MMKKTCRIGCLAAAAVLILTSVSGCAKTGLGSQTGYETPDPERRFNEGIVDYIVDREEFFEDPFDTSKTGTVVTESTTGVVALFDADFSKTGIDADGEAVYRSEDAVGIADGELFVPYDATSDDHFGVGWTTWAPQTECLTDEFIQTQFSTDCRFFSTGGGAWMSAFIGIFKSNVGSIADNGSDGIYISFNVAESTLTLYGGRAEDWKWPVGNATLKVNKELMQGDTHLDIVCTQSKEVLVFLKGINVARIEIDEGAETIKLFNAEGKEKYSGEIDADSIEGGFFSVFSHLGGIAMKNLKIFGATRGRKKVNESIRAVPVGDNSLGLDITDKQDLIGICYTMWFNAIHGNGEGKIETALNVAELTEKYGFSQEYGFGTKDDRHNATTAFHYWSKPAQGYYRSTDTDAIRNNMTLLYNAGVDFIILDYTYASAPGYLPGTSTWNSYIGGPSKALLNTIMQMRAEGKGTPYVVFWVNDSSMFDAIGDQFMDKEEWKDCFVYWDGKPFIMKWNYDPANESYDRFTVRGMYGLRGKASTGQWTYLEIDNSSTVSYDADGKPEHISAAVATQETYMSLPTAHGRNGGKFWNEQWKNAFKYHPKIVTVTWWNEWCAQLYYVEGVGFVFTDNFNQEYSRDVEPMEGGHGDQYYKWLCEYIRCYRNHEACPDLTEK